MRRTSRRGGDPGRGQRSWPVCSWVFEEKDEPIGAEIHRSSAEERRVQTPSRPVEEDYTL